MVKKRPFRLWVGCGNATDHEGLRPHGTPADAATDIVWTCIATMEVPFMKRLLFAPNARPEVVDLFERVRRLVGQTPGTTFVDEP